MVDVYMAKVDGLPDPLEHLEYLEKLSENRREKIKRYKQNKSRLESFCAGLLLEYVLSLHGFSAESIRYGEKGKPEADGFCFNLSHSDGVVVCVLGEKAVGCDVEKMKEAPMRIAERFFCENEMAHLKGADSKNQDDTFYRLWTMKESYMKMTGEGLTVPLNSYEMILEEPVKVKRDGILQTCNMKEYEIPGYKMTVCAEEHEFSELQIVDVHKLIEK